MHKRHYKNSSIRTIPGAAVCILLLCLLLLGCEKEVHINLSSGASQLVVEGAIENDLPPYVILTKSIGYLSKIDLSTQQNSYVHDAAITVSDGSQTIKLREYLLDSVVDGNHYKFYIYSIDTADISAPAEPLVLKSGGGLVAIDVRGEPVPAVAVRICTTASHDALEIVAVEGEEAILIRPSVFAPQAS